MSSLTIDDIKDKTVVMIGSTVGYLSSRNIAEKLSKFNVTIKTQFTKDVSVAFYNPSKVTNAKITKAKNLGIKMFTYDEVKSFVDELSGKPKPIVIEVFDDSKIPSVKIPDDSLKPLVRGKYLGTKPYYFKNIVPVLEPDLIPECQRYYSEDGYITLNNALQGTNGSSLKDLSSIERQYLEDLILLIQVRGKHYHNVVYRGISEVKATDKYLKMNVGDSFIKEGFMSTSLHKYIAEDFSNWDMNLYRYPSVMIYFEVPSSVKGLFIYNRNEQELLFPPRSGFTITKIEEHDVEYGEANNKYLRRRRKIYAKLFIDSAFKTLNTSGKFIKSIS